VGSRRFRPLILCVLGLTALVFARLFQLQVLEHEVWAREAVNLVRSSAVIPYRRGSIVDRLGRPLVTDEDVYRVEFRYRDFRRGHPLGQVAHAWSSLELRPVPLDDARSQLVSAGLELAQLTHAQLDAFAEGGALETGTLWVGAAVPGRAEYRLSRRADLRFYVSRLLQLDRREALNAVRSKEEFPSMLAYALTRRPELGGDREALLDELALRLQASLDDLQRLADELHGGCYRSTTRSRTIRGRSCSARWIVRRPAAGSCSPCGPRTRGCGA
jgi:cell division protein FtsI/penicillin-binding protein 2